MEHIHNLNELNDAIEASVNNLVVVDCYTEWCGPCKRLTPLLEKLMAKHEGIKIYKLNIELDEVKDWVQIKEISSVPTIFVMKNKKDVGIIEGADIDKIEEEIVKNK